MSLERSLKREIRLDTVRATSLLSLEKIKEKSVKLIFGLEQQERDVKLLQIYKAQRL